VGLLLSKPLASLVSGEDALVTDLASDRTEDANTVTEVFSELANTPAIVATTAVVAIVLRLAYKRWRESMVLITAVALQAAVFLATTLVIDRERPKVPQLDPAPPTSSFPSGHTGAATALYVGLALVLTWHVRRTALRVLVLAAFLALPVLVGVARMYRGMHHPTDVLFGILNGAACLTVAARVILLRRGAG
jgi:undecaprenyl-diphosphatase